MSTSYSFTLAEPSAIKESNLEHMDEEGKRLEKLFGTENLKVYLTTVGS